MNKTQFKEEFKKTLDTMYSIMKKKNADYAKTDPFGNFNLVKELGITSVEKGILVRMADKMSRISNLIDQEAQVKDEAIEDTLQDLANYAVILKIYLEDKRNCPANGCDVSEEKTKRYPDEVYQILGEAHNFFISDRSKLEFEYDGKEFETHKELEKYILNKFKNDTSN